MIIDFYRHLTFIEKYQVISRKSIKSFDCRAFYLFKTLLAPAGMLPGIPIKTNFLFNSSMRRHDAKIPLKFKLFVLQISYIYMYI